MLRRIRISRFILLCWVTALGWVMAGTLDMAGVVNMDDDLIVLAGAGLFTVALLCHIGRQMDAHRVGHRRLDRQLSAAASILRRTYRDEGLGAYIPPAHEDDRALRPDGAAVVEIRPRAPHARHARASRLKP